MSALGFYTYEHTRNDTGAVFYVGKGRGRRSCATYNRNIHWKRVVAKSGGFAVRIVVEGVDEDFAFLVEMERIDQLRRLGVKLCNMTDGGEGTAGLFVSEETKRKQSDKRRGHLHPQYGKPKSDETKDKLRIASTGKKLSDESRAKISNAITGRKESLETRQKKSLALSGRVGVKPNEETRRKMSEASKGKPKSDEMRRRLSESRKGVKQRIVKCPFCKQQGSISNMKRWHFENCKHKEST
jgi:hypothetical protein